VQGIIGFAFVASKGKILHRILPNAPKFTEEEFLFRCLSVTSAKFGEELFRIRSVTDGRMCHPVRIFLKICTTLENEKDAYSMT
jgi:hypothetical protein